MKYYIITLINTNISIIGYKHNISLSHINES